jgi:hypothetical protein
VARPADKFGPVLSSVRPRAVGTVNVGVTGEPIEWSRIFVIALVRVRGVELRGVVSVG